MSLEVSLSLVVLSESVVMELHYKHIMVSCDALHIFNYHFRSIRIICMRCVTLHQFFFISGAEKEDTFCKYHSKESFY